MARSPTSADERDRYPRKTPPKGHPAAELAVPHEVADDITGTYSGEERQRMRERRETPDRIRQLERNGDDIRTEFGEFRTEVVERLAVVETEMRGVKGIIERDIEERRLERQLQAQAETNQVGLEKVRLTSRTKIIVAVIGLLSAIFGIAGTLLVKAVS